MAADDERAERSRSRAMMQRSLESDVFAQLTEMLPLAQKAKNDRLTVLRLLVSYLNCRWAIEKAEREHDEVMRHTNLSTNEASPQQPKEELAPKDLPWSRPQILLADRDGNIVVDSFSNKPEITRLSQEALPPQDGEEEEDELTAAVSELSPGVLGATAPVHDPEEQRAMLERYKRGLEQGMREFLGQTPVNLSGLDLGTNSDTGNGSRNGLQIKSEVMDSSEDNPGDLDGESEESLVEGSGLEIVKSNYPSGNIRAVLDIEAEANLMLEAANGFLLMLDNTFTVIFASENVSQFLGYTQSQVIGQSILAFMHERDIPQMKQFMGLDTLSEEMVARSGSNPQATKTAFLMDLKYCFPKKSSKYKITGSSLFQWNCRLTLGSDTTTGKTKVEGMLSLCRHIKSDSIIVGPSDGNLVQCKMGLDFSLLALDPSLENMTGFTPTEILSADPYMLKHPCDVYLIHVQHKSLIEHGKADSGYHRMISKQGTWMWTFSRMELVTNRQNKPSYIQLYCYIVSPKIAEAALCQDEEEYKRFRGEGFGRAFQSLQESFSETKSPDSNESYADKKAGEGSSRQLPAKGAIAPTIEELTDREIASMSEKTGCEKLKALSKQRKYKRAKMSHDSVAPKPVRGKSQKLGKVKSKHGDGQKAQSEHKQGDSKLEKSKEQENSEDENNSALPKYGNLVKTRYEENSHQSEPSHDTMGETKPRSVEIKADLKSKRDKTENEKNSTTGSQPQSQSSQEAPNHAKDQPIIVDEKKETLANSQREFVEIEQDPIEENERQVDSMEYVVEGRVVRSDSGGSSSSEDSVYNSSNPWPGLPTPRAEDISYATCEDISEFCASQNHSCKRNSISGGSGLSCSPEEKSSSSQPHGAQPSQPDSSTQSDGLASPDSSSGHVTQTQGSSNTKPKMSLSKTHLSHNLVEAVQESPPRDGSPSVTESIASPPSQADANDTQLQNCDPPDEPNTSVSDDTGETLDEETILEEIPSLGLESIPFDLKTPYIPVSVENIVPVGGESDLFSEDPLQGFESNSQDDPESSHKDNVYERLGNDISNFLINVSNTGTNMIDVDDPSLDQIMVDKVPQLDADELEHILCMIENDAQPATNQFTERSILCDLVSRPMTSGHVQIAGNKVVDGSNQSTILQMSGVGNKLKSFNMRENQAFHAFVDNPEHSSTLNDPERMYPAIADLLKANQIAGSVKNSQRFISKPKGSFHFQQNQRSTLSQSSESHQNWANQQPTTNATRGHQVKQNLSDVSVRHSSKPRTPHWQAPVTNSHNVDNRNGPLLVNSYTHFLRHLSPASPNHTSVNQSGFQTISTGVPSSILGQHINANYNGHQTFSQSAHEYNYSFPQPPPYNQSYRGQMSQSNAISFSSTSDTRGWSELASQKPNHNPFFDDQVKLRSQPPLANQIGQSPARHSTHYPTSPALHPAHYRTNHARYSSAGYPFSNAMSGSTPNDSCHPNHGSVSNSFSTTYHNAAPFSIQHTNHRSATYHSSQPKDTSGPNSKAFSHTSPSSTAYHTSLSAESSAVYPSSHTTIQPSASFPGFHD